MFSGYCCFDTSWGGVFWSWGIREPAKLRLVGLGCLRHSGPRRPRLVLLNFCEAREAALPPPASFLAVDCFLSSTGLSPAELHNYWNGLKVIDCGLNHVYSCGRNVYANLNVPCFMRAAFWRELTNFVDKFKISREIEGLVLCFDLKKKLEAGRGRDRNS